MRVDCQACGWILEVPPEVREGQELSCGRCGLIFRWGDAARGFRWAAQDPFVRARGAKRFPFFALLAAGALWVPALAIAHAARGRLDLGFVAASGVPWLVVLVALARLRARRPTFRWLTAFWIAIGLYALWLALLLRLAPAWRPLLGVREDGGGTDLFVMVGIVALAVGAAGGAFHRWSLARLPRAVATPRER